MSRSGLACDSSLSERKRSSARSSGVALYFSSKSPATLRDLLPFGAVEDARALLLVEGDQALRRQGIGRAEGAGEDAAGGGAGDQVEQLPDALLRAPFDLGQHESGDESSNPSTVDAEHSHLPARYNSGGAPACDDLLRGGPGDRCSSAAAAPLDPNPCLTVFAKGLRCPDIVMDRPWGIYLDGVTKPGRALLRAGNAIESIGRGRSNCTACATTASTCTPASASTSAAAAGSRCEPGPGCA